MASYTILAFALMAVSMGSGKVIELTDSDFDSRLKQHGGLSLVMFYAPWCGHCKKMKPEFERASKTLLDNDPPVHLAKVDCTGAGKETCGRFDVSGYPTVKIFNGKELSEDYEGPREADGIVDHMKRQAAPASREFDCEESLDNFVAKEPTVVVAGFLTGDADLETFQKVASKMRHSVTFVHFPKPVKDREGIYLIRPSHLQSKFEDKELRYSEKIEKRGVEAWVESNYHGLVGHRKMDEKIEFPKPLVVAYYDVDYKKNPKGTNYWRNRVMKVAKKFKQLTFAISNRYDFQHEADEFGLPFNDPQEKGAPSVAIHGEDGKKYTMQEVFSVDNFEKFLDDFVTGKVEPYLKSEPIPEDNSGPVKIAVAKNFDELVMKNERDVLLEFYAPWCGHCKKLAPVYDELGKAMEGEDVDIVKMDATANDVPSQFKVRGFPTLYWLPAKEKKPISYNGDREVDDFIKYIAEHSTSGLKNYDKAGKKKKTEL